MNVAQQELFVAARWLAATGRHRTALVLLDLTDREGAGRDSVWLRGQIYAQTGRYEEAIRVWQTLLSEGAAAPEVTAAITKARQLQARGTGPVSRRPQLAIAGGAIAVVICLLGAGWMVSRSIVRWDQRRMETLRTLVKAETESSVNLVLERRGQEQQRQLLGELQGLRQQLTARSAPDGSLVRTGAESAKNQEGDHAIPAEDRRRLEALVAEVKSQQGTINSMEAAGRNAREAFAADLQGLQREIQRLTSQLQGAGARMEHWNQAMLEWARHYKMDDLDRELKRIQAVIGSLRQEELRLRDKKNFADSRRLGRVQRELKTQEARLKEVQQQWDSEAERWSSLRRALAPAEGKSEAL
jgi:hypothetical protein